MSSSIDRHQSFDYKHASDMVLSITYPTSSMRSWPLFSATIAIKTNQAEQFEIEDFR